MYLLLFMLATGALAIVQKHVDNCMLNHCKSFIL